MEIAQTVDYALRVLLALEAKNGQTTSDLAHSIGLHRSVLHRTIGTLRRRAAVSRDISGRYWLGPLLVRLARGLPHELAYVGGAELASFAVRSTETVVLSVREGSDSVVVAQEQGHRGPLRVEYEVDFHQPLDRGASSLAILAYLDDVPSTAKTTRTTHLAEIRERGFARTLGEIKPHMIGLAVPILTRHGVGGSIAIVAPTTREEHIDSLLPDLQKTASRISATYETYLDGQLVEGLT